MRFSVIVGCFLLLLCFFPGYGQEQAKPEELETWLKQARKDSIYVDKLNLLSNDYSFSGQKDPLPYAKQALKLADSLSYTRGQGIARLSLAIIYDSRGMYHPALENYLIAMKLLRKVRDEDYLAQLYQNLGIFYSTQGNYRQAIVATKQAADLTLKNRKLQSVSYCWGNLGYFYTETTQYDSALFFTLKAYEVFKQEKDTAGLAEVFYNLANIAWKADKNAAKALNHSLQALEFYEVPPFELEAYVGCKAFVGNMYLQLKNYPLAERYLQESYHEAHEQQFRFLMKNICEWQAELYAAMGNWELAYDRHRRFFQLHDSIFSEHTANRVEQLKAEYELGTREANIELLKKGKIIQADELEKQMVYRNSFMALFALFLVVAGILYKNNRTKNRANALLLEQKQQIQDKNAAIMRQNQLLEEQKEAILSHAQTLSQANSQIIRQRQAIEEKTQDLSSSLSYASRIQSAMMPHPAELKLALPDSFIWLQPKELVSGDFYWFAHFQDKVFLAAIDCTGHGVPVAFLSLIGDVYLNQVILQEEVHQADQILNRLHEQVLRTLKQESTFSQDGMEIGLCVIDLAKKEVEFAGARNNLYYCSQGEVKKIHGDRTYVGSTTSCDFSSFTAHRISFQQPTAFYLSTNGVRDQFGGEQDKKMGEKRLFELIEAMWELPMEQQHEHLRQYMRSWMHGYEQTDDMMVVGWKL